jgi:hypothetical protein
MSEGYGLVQQQDWDAVADFVAQAAALAEQRAFAFAVFQLTLAPRAREHG